MLVRVSGVLSSTSLGGERLRLRGHSAAGGMKLKAWSSYAEVCKRLGPQNDIRGMLKGADIMPSQPKDLRTRA